MSETRGEKRKISEVEEPEEQGNVKRAKLFDLQDDDEYTIEIDEQTGEKYAVCMIQGGLKRVPLDRPVRVYADGIYDLFHLGHARSLQQAKGLFPDTCLVVGVCGDAITHKLKGKTVMNEKERTECVSHCRYVDEVVDDAPWVVTVEYMEKHNIDFVSHGEDLSVDENGEDVYKHIKEMGKFLTIKRTEGISTTDLILRIVKDYDKYVRRNLQRGLSAKEMNVGFVKEKQILMKEKLDEWKHNLNKQKDKLFDLNKWKHVSEDIVQKFVQRFHLKKDNQQDDDGAESPMTPDTPAAPEDQDQIISLNTEPSSD